MSAGFDWIVVMMLALGTGGGGDTLSYVPTDAYWKAKNVAVTAEAMAAELKAPVAQPADANAPKANDIRRLMAIRALGELKAKDAAAALKALTESKELFVADYARDALAAIEGKPTIAPRPAAAVLAKDVGVLGANCAAVFQVCLRLKTQPGMDALMAQMPEMDEAAKADTKDRLLQTLIPMLERSGNARLEAMTLGVSDDIGPRKGSIVMIARGVYDANATREVLRSASDFTASVKRENPTFDGVEVIRVGGDAGFILPSDDCLVLVTGPGTKELPYEATIKAIKAGKGSLAENAEMAKLLKSVDANSPLWAVIEVSEAYGQCPYLDGLDSVTLTANVKDDTIAASVAAIGKDANDVPQFLESVKADIDSAKDRLTKTVERFAAAKVICEPFISLLDSISIKADGVKLTAKAEIKNASKFLTLMPMRMLGSMSVRSSATGGQSQNARPAATPRGTDF